MGFHLLSSPSLPLSRRGIFNSSIYGLTYAFSQSTIFFMYAAIFRFGAYQVILPEDNVAHESFQDVFRVFTALIFGAISIGQAGAFAPNYTKARLSANRIFHLLDRVPEIDGYSVDGAAPVSPAFDNGTSSLGMGWPVYKLGCPVMGRLTVMKQGFCVIVTARMNSAPFYNGSSRIVMLVCSVNRTMPLEPWRLRASPSATRPVPT